VFVSLQITWMGLDEQQEETRGTYMLRFEKKETSISLVLPAWLA
jgi:hypothetical protein